MIASFFLAGRPKPKNERSAGRGGRIYYDPKVKRHQADLEIQASTHAPPRPLTGPVELSLTFWMPIPQRPKPHQAPGAPHTFKPDADNLAKMVKDAMTNCGFWIDDSQVYALIAIKRYGATPGVQVEINGSETADKGQ